MIVSFCFSPEAVNNALILQQRKPDPKQQSIIHLGIYIVAILQPSRLLAQQIELRLIHLWWSDLAIRAALFDGGTAPPPYIAVVERQGAAVSDLCPPSICCGNNGKITPSSHDNVTFCSLCRHTTLMQPPLCHARHGLSAALCSSLGPV